MGSTWRSTAAGCCCERRTSRARRPVVRHHVRRCADIVPTAAYEGRSKGFTRCSLVDEHVGSVHMGLGLCTLEGHVQEHVHSFEESFYVVTGAPVLYMNGRGHALAPGACGVVPVGVPHAWSTKETASWI